ncbi:MAG: response regulator [Myxococcota bacterium]|nr:response regulator [Myxococcota bacterium]
MPKREQDPERPLVLVVEDCEDACAILLETLRFHGFRAIAARNGADALLRANELRPAAILLDLSLPVLDGWSVARALRREPRTRDIPIVVLTAHVHEPELARAREVGCDRIFTKPAPHDRLLMELHQLIRRSAAHAPAS